MATMPETGTQQPRRPMWHAPLFVLGVAALAGVLHGRPFFKDRNPEGRVARDLANARSILNKADGNADFALKVAQRALELAEQRVPERAGEAALLTGWAFQKLAEKAEPVRAPDLWRQSHAALEQARTAGVPEDDRPRLAFRVGKAAMLAGDFRKALNDLEQSTGSLEHRVEAYMLLAQGCLRVEPPELLRALKANRELRELAHEITEEQATAAKLQGGDILLRLGKPDEARASLEKITDTAAPAILQQARVLRARSYQEEKRWQEAALMYKEALADSRAALEDAALARFYLGMCYRHLDQPAEAAAAWTECVQTAKGPEGLAAGLALAEAHLAAPDYEKAASALARAAAVAPPVGKWDNKFLTAEQYAGVFTRTLEAMRQADRHDLVLNLAAAYAKAVPPREALEMKARSAAALGAQLKEQHKLKPEEATLRQAREMLTLAGAAREEAAGLAGLGPAEQGEELFQAAGHHLAADDATRAAGVLFRLVETKGVKPARLGEAWYRLAEHHRENGQKAKAADAYRKCMEFDTRFAYRARYQLAMAALEAGELDDAEAALVLNLKLLRFDSHTETLGARAQSLFAIGNLLYQRKDYRRVIRYLEDATGQLKENAAFKDTADFTRARFQLADSYRQIAARESQSIHVGGSSNKEAKELFEKQYRIWQRQAADEFVALDQYLQTPAGQGHLTAEQRGQVPFIAARALSNLGQHAEALKIIGRLIKQHGHSKEGLDALGMAVSCHDQMGKTDLVRQRMLEIELALPHVPPDVQTPWKEWLKIAKEQLPPMEKDARPKSPAPPPMPTPAAPPMPTPAAPPMPTPMEIPPEGPILGPPPKDATPPKYPPTGGPGTPGGSGGRG